ncbi:hypothetical protein LguiA_032535 [Lonicera macranthoides]
MLILLLTSGTVCNVAISYLRENRRKPGPDRLLKDSILEVSLVHCINYVCILRFIQHITPA